MTWKLMASTPDLESLETFMREQMHWTTAEIRDGQVWQAHTGIRSGLRVRSVKGRARLEMETP